MRASILIAAAFALVGCGEETPRTQVMVFVQAEPGVQMQASRLDVEVRGAQRGGLRPVIDTFTYTDASSDEGFMLMWPIRIALVPQDVVSDRVYEVVATASATAGPIAQTRVVGSYLDRETLRLDVWLRDDCLGTICDVENQTCVGGACATVMEVDPCTLQRYDDSGTACGGDAGVDAPVDTGVDAPADAGPLGTYNVAFVGSIPVVPGELGTVDAADTLCQMLSESDASIVPTGTYRAFMHGNGTTVRQRFDGVQGWVRPDGRPFVDTLQDMFDGRIYYPIRFTERNDDPSDDFVISGVDWDLMETGESCDYWTDTSGRVFTGDRRDGTVGWIRRGVRDRSCGESSLIYCFGTDRSEPLPAPSAPPPAAPIAFLSATDLAGSAGVTAFDDQCQAEAADTMYAGRTFRALVREAGGGGPLDRIIGSGPWYRPDGVSIGDRSNLVNNQLEASISLTADGTAYRGVYVWTGSATPMEASGLNCSDWTMGGMSEEGTIAWSGYTTLFHAGVRFDCSESHRVYCFQTEP